MTPHAWNEPEFSSGTSSTVCRWTCRRCGMSTYRHYRRICVVTKTPERFMHGDKSRRDCDAMMARAVLAS